MYEAEKRVRRYERLYGQRVLKPLLPQVLKSAPDPALGGVWLDWEAGSGVVSMELLRLLSKDSTLLATDTDRAALRVFHSHPELDKDARCFARQDAADAVGLAPGVVDVAMGHWRWQFLETPEPAIKELCRIVRPAGTIVLSFLIPGGGGPLVEAFNRIGETQLADIIRDDGIATQRVREMLRAGEVAQIEVRQVQFTVAIGASSRPMMDPLFLDFLLPRWMSLASGEEITNITQAPFDLGSDPIVWDLRVGIASAILPA